jgi:hypothetical protein
MILVHSSVANVQCDAESHCVLYADAEVVTMSLQSG